MTLNLEGRPDARRGALGWSRPPSPGDAQAAGVFHPGRSRAPCQGTASTLPRSPGSFRFVRVGVGVGIVDGVGDVGVVSPNAIVGQL